MWLRRSVRARGRWPRSRCARLIGGRTIFQAEDGEDCAEKQQNGNQVYLFGHGVSLSKAGFGEGASERFGARNNGSGRELEGEAGDFKIVESLAIPGEFEPARDEAGVFQSLQMQMQQRAADANLARELADVIAAIGLQRRDDAQPLRIGECGEHGEQLVARDWWIKGFYHV